MVKRLLIISVILIALLVAAWFYKSYKMVPELPAYEHDLISESGQTVKLSSLKGKYVLISYFQTWCGSCIKELPSIDALQQQVGKDKLSVIIVSDEGMEKILRFKEKYCNTLDYYQSSQPLNDINIRIFPTTYLLDPQGQIILSKLEDFDWSSEEVLTLIEK
ncbi:MAG: thiol-disulfide oxidoreductase [Bacteroidota bacterium]|jgi:peroxiredoxin|nr:thiol-disulfide oxidoreductase [Bacteroidota bacterium]